MIDQLVQWLNDDEALPRSAFSRWPRQVTKWLVSSEVLLAVGYLQFLTCTACHRGHRAELQSSPKGRRYYCREVGWVYPEADAIIAHRIDMLAFARILAVSLSLPQKRGRAKGDTRLIMLGDHNFRGAMRTLYLARQADTAQQISELARLVDAAGSKNTGLVLCTGEAPASVRTKHRHQFFPLGDALQLHAGKVRLDVEKIAAWSRDLDRTRARESAPKPAAADWLSEAIAAWKRLHAAEQIGPNVAEMGRQVRLELTGTDDAADNIPQAKAISDELRKLHRRHYPKRRNRRR